MNCKPGDLAVIVSGQENVGRICTVLAQSQHHGEGWWYVEIHGSKASGNFIKTGKPGFAHKGHIADSRLRPIRNPGDDARDETLDWLPVPHKEVA